MATVEGIDKVIKALRKRVQETLEGGAKVSVVVGYTQAYS
jgi:hypothetical protein